MVLSPDQECIKEPYINKHKYSNNLMQMVSSEPYI